MQASAIVGANARQDATGQGRVSTPEQQARAELMASDNASLDSFWLRDETLADSDNLPPSDVIAQEIVDDLDAALEQFRLIAADLGETNSVEP